MTRTPAYRRLGPLAIAAVLAVALSGCVGGAEPEPTPASAVPSPVATATVAPVVLVAEGTADENLAYFTQIVQTVAAGPQSVEGRAYIDALVAGGFDKAAMQVTNDKSTVGNDAESIQFSVRWGEECLMGQVGPSTGAPVTTVMAGLAAGGCLVGNTRTIDW